MLGTFSIPPGTPLRLSPAAAGLARKTSFTPKRQPTCAAMTSNSLYEVLQVKHDASFREIKTAYRSLAKLYHPDVAPVTEAVNGGKEFIEILEAYARLSDPETRAEYDMALRLTSVGRRRQGLDVRARAGVYTTRRWETDQCW